MTEYSNVKIGVSFGEEEECRAAKCDETEDVVSKADVETAAEKAEPEQNQRKDDVSLRILSNFWGPPGGWVCFSGIQQKQGRTP